MKEELLKNIDTSAAELRSIKGVQRIAEANIDAQCEAIESLKKSLEEAEKVLRTRYEERTAVAAQVKQASDRYTFYINEAIQHPY